jgi:hypothetical protein
MKYILKFKPRYCYQWICIIFVAILLASSWAAYKNLRANLNETIEIGPEHIAGFRNISLVPQKNQKKTLPSIHFTGKIGNAKLAINFPKPIRTGVLEIEVDPAAKLYLNYMYLRLIGTKPFRNTSKVLSLNIKSNNWLPLRPNTHRYRIPLYRDQVKGNVILEIKYSGNLPGIPINSIKVKPATFYDFPAGALVVSVAVLLSMFLPGLLIIVLFPKLNVLPLSLTTFLFTLMTNLGSLVIWKIFNNGILVLPLLMIAFFGAGLFSKGRREQISLNIRTLCGNCIPEINVWFCVLALVSVVLSFGYPSPVANIHQGHITSEHTFKAFTAHDSVFQFVNSKSIISGDFEKYYGNESFKKLLFMPQDREIFPGLSYAPTILMIKKLLGNKVSEQYFPYAVYFLVCHGLMLCMLFSWMKNYNLKVAYAATFYIATTPVFWTLAMVGWFKLTGAAMILAGMYLVKDKPHLILRWVLAGFLFGLAKNYHGSNALALPIFTMWMLYVTYRTTRGITFLRLGVMFGSITTFACLLIFPWNWYVKNVWEVGAHRLFSMHFLSNNFVGNSLWQSIVNFTSNNPWTDQLGVRLERTLGVFNLQWMMENYARYELYGYGTVKSFLKFSSSYFFAAILPYLLLTLCIIIYVKISAKEESKKTVKGDLWISQFGWICLINVIFLAFISYGPAAGRAAITWHLPSLVIIGVLAHFVYWSSTYYRGSYFVWTCVGFFQLALLVTYG